MTLANLPGGFAQQFGIGSQFLGGSQPQGQTQAIAATKAAVIYVGYIITSDGSSHTINTTGSSSIQWQTGSVTFSNAGTTAVVGLAAVDLSNGPPARAVNVADVITFDVSRVMTGGGGGVTSSAWQTHVPTAGTKTIANGDFVAFAVQLTSRGGTDTIAVTGSPVGNPIQIPTGTFYNATTYAAMSQSPDVIIVFSDGTLGWFYTTDVFSVVTGRTFNSGSATKEYGQLYNLPFPYRINGIYGWINFSGTSADFDAVLYSDPLGTPVAQKTVSVDANAVATTASGRRFSVLFPSPYDVAANTNIATIFKPGATSIDAYYKTLANAAHRVTDTGGTSSYGVSRASGAFANANSSLDHYYIGMLVSAFDAGGGGGSSMLVHPGMQGGARG